MSRRNIERREKRTNERNEKEHTVSEKESIMADVELVRASMVLMHVLRLARNTPELFKKATIRYLDQRTRRVVWNISSSGVFRRSAIRMAAGQPTREETKAGRERERKKEREREREREGVRQRVLASAFFFNYHPPLYLYTRFASRPSSPLVR